MAQNPKPILPAADQQFTHNGRSLNFGIRSSKADGDVTFVCGAVINNIDFDQQITLHFGADEYGQGTTAEVAAKVPFQLKLVNEKIAQIYGPFGTGGTVDLYDKVLAAVTQFCKTSVVYDPAVGLKLK
jgi:hypothetical protein